MPTTAYAPERDEVIDAEVVDTDPRSGAQRHEPPPQPTPSGARRHRDNYDDPFERRLNEFECSAGEYMRDMRHRAKQARRFVTKNSGDFKRKKVRTTVGVAGRVAGVGVAGGYLAARTGVKHGRRAYKRAAPHVRRVAGDTARYAHTRATVYSQHYRKVAYSKALRAIARQRVAGRQRAHLRRNPGLHAALVATGAKSTRNMKIARRAARLLSPDTSPPSNANLDRETRQRAESVRRDPRRPIHTPNGGEWAFSHIDSTPESSVPRAASSHATPPRSGNGASTARQRQGGNTVAIATNSTTNPAAVLESGFKLTGDYSPINWVDWMQQLRAQAAAFRQASQSYLQLAVHMDLVRRMDPRALMGLYVIAAAMGQAADVFIATANQFWMLYNDRFETNGRGRTMDDENAFFGQQ